MCPIPRTAAGWSRSGARLRPSGRTRAAALSLGAGGRVANRVTSVFGFFCALLDIPDHEVLAIQLLDGLIVAATQLLFAALERPTGQLLDAPLCEAFSPLAICGTVRQWLCDVDAVKTLSHKSIFYVYGIVKRTSRGRFRVVCDESAAISCSLGVFQRKACRRFLVNVMPKTPMRGLPCAARSTLQKPYADDNSTLTSLS
jgi:hypothetical protein